MGKESISANGGVGKRGDEGRRQRSKDSKFGERKLVKAYIAQEREKGTASKERWQA